LTNILGEAIENAISSFVGISLLSKILQPALLTEERKQMVNPKKILKHLTPNY
jgi:hypothetical protein